MIKNCKDFIFHQPVMFPRHNLNNDNNETVVHPLHRLHYNHLGSSRAHFLSHAVRWELVKAEISSHHCIEGFKKQRLAYKMWEEAPPSI